MTTVDYPVNIQQELDAWLAEHPDAQKYIEKLWYLDEDHEPALGVTHLLELRSATSPERALLIGVEAVPSFAVVLEALLALVSTQPPAA
jgi:hypothetical protein